MRFLLLVLALVPADWDKAKSSFRKAFREGTLEEKVAAVRAIGAFDRVESAELLVEAWHDSEVRLRNKGDADIERKLRDAIALTVGSYTDKLAVRYLARQLRENESPAFRDVVASAAWRLGGDDIKAALLAAATREKSALALASVLNSLRILKVPDARAGFVEKLAHAHWRVRREATRAVVELDAVEAIPVLIESLREDGLWRDEINAALGKLTGIDKHGDFAAWYDWWQREKEGYEKRRPTAKERLAMLEKPRGPGQTVATFYGTRVVSKRVIFLIDLSGSMEERATWRPEGDAKAPRIGTRKIDVAKHEMRRALGQLAGDGKFNVLTYEKKVNRFAEPMAENTKEKRDELAVWMDAWETEGGTDVWGGLASALSVAGVHRDKLTADTIYLITDGKPTLGTPEWILNKVRGLNEAGKILIHTIGVGNDIDAAFLEQLAEENGGTFTQR